MKPEVALVIALFAMLASLFASMRLDRRRVKRHFAERGGVVSSIRWLPFGRGWLGSLHETIYAVRYRDTGGIERRAVVHTSILTGVHVDEDREAGAGA